MIPPDKGGWGVITVTLSKVEGQRGVAFNCLHRFAGIHAEDIQNNQSNPPLTPPYEGRGNNKFLPITQRVFMRGGKA